MRIDASIEYNGAGLKLLGDAIRTALGRALAAIGDAVLEVADEKVPVGASNTLKDSGQRIPPNPFDWVMVQYTAEYAAAVHEGSVPHWPPPKVMNPGGELYRWVQLVLGIHEEKEATKVAHAIGAFIARFGGAPQPWLRDAWEEVEPDVEGILKREFEKELKRLAVD